MWYRYETKKPAAYRMIYKEKIHIKVTSMKSLYTTWHRLSKKKFDEFICRVLSPDALTELAKKVKFV